MGFHLVRHGHPGNHPGVKTPLPNAPSVYSLSQLNELEPFIKNIMQTYARHE